MVMRSYTVVEVANITAEYSQIIACNPERLRRDETMPPSENIHTKVAFIEIDSSAQNPFIGEAKNPILEEQLLQL